MAKRSSTGGISKQRKLKEDIKPPVLLCLLKSVNLTLTGSSTGKKYNFKGAGSEVLVDAKDAPEMLARKSNTSCCGDPGTNYFEIV